MYFQPRRPEITHKAPDGNCRGAELGAGISRATMRPPATPSSQARRAFAASVEGLPLAIAAAKAFQQDGMRSVADEIAQADWHPTMLIEVIDGATQGTWNFDDMKLAFHM